MKKFIEGLLKLAGGQMPTADLLAEAKLAVEEGDHQAALRSSASWCSRNPRMPRPSPASPAR